MWRKERLEICYRLPFFYVGKGAVGFLLPKTPFCVDIRAAEFLLFLFTDGPFLPTIFFCVTKGAVKFWLLTTLFLPATILCDEKERLNFLPPITLFLYSIFFSFLLKAQVSHVTPLLLIILIYQSALKIFYIRSIGMFYKYY